MFLYGKGNLVLKRNKSNYKNWEGIKEKSRFTEWHANVLYAVAPIKMLFLGWCLKITPNFGNKYFFTRFVYPGFQWINYSSHGGW